MLRQGRNKGVGGCTATYNEQRWDKTAIVEACAKSRPCHVLAVGGSGFELLYPSSVVVADTAECTNQEAGCANGLSL